MPYYQSQAWRCSRANRPHQREQTNHKKLCHSCWRLRKKSLPQANGIRMRDLIDSFATHWTVSAESVNGVPQLSFGGSSFKRSRLCPYVPMVMGTSPVRSGVRTHADNRPLELKSNALTTRPSWQSHCTKKGMPTIATRKVVIHLCSMDCDKIFQFDSASIHSTASDTLWIAACSRLIGCVFFLD